jgi:hypothetical protein
MSTSTYCDEEDLARIIIQQKKQINTFWSYYFEVSSRHQIGNVTFGIGDRSLEF